MLTCLAAWRKTLKDLIIFFKEIQKSYETRSKLFLSASNVINNSVLPPSFLKTGGLADATDILRDFHRQGYMEANKAAEVENEVVNQLMGLRNDLHSTAAAWYLVELADRFCEGAADSHEAFRLLAQGLSALDAGSEVAREVVARWFELALLDAMGFRPELTRCLECGAFGPAATTLRADIKLIDLVLAKLGVTLGVAL